MKKSMMFLVSLSILLGSNAFAQTAGEFFQMKVACRALRPDIQTSEGNLIRARCEADVEAAIAKARPVIAPAPVAPPQKDAPVDAAKLVELQRQNDLLKQLLTEKKAEQEKPQPKVPPVIPPHRMGMMPGMMGGGVPLGTIMPKAGNHVASTWKIPGISSYLEIQDIRTAVMDRLYAVPPELRVIVYKNGSALAVIHDSAAQFLPVFAKLDGAGAKVYYGFNAYEVNTVFVPYTPGDSIELVICATPGNITTQTGLQEVWTPILRLRFDKLRDPGVWQMGALLGQRVYN